MKKIALLTLCCLMISSICLAETNSLEYEFTKDYIDSLSHLSNIEKWERFESTEFVNESDASMAFSRLEDLTIGEIEMAKSYITKYTDSENSLIKKTADGILSVYNIFKEAFQRLLKYEEKHKNPEDFDLRQNIEEMNRFAIDILKGFWMLPMCSSKVANCLLDRNSDEKGYPSYLVITSKEREDLIDRLISVFGDSIKNGASEKKSFFELTAQTLYIVLAGEFKSSDER